MAVLSLEHGGDEHRLYMPARLCRRHPLVYEVRTKHGGFVFPRFAVLFKSAVYDGLAVAHHPHLMAHVTVDDSGGCKPFFGMGSHPGGDAATGIFGGNALRYALAEGFHRGVGGHLPDVSGDEKHGRTAVLHRGVKAERCLARAAVDYGGKMVGHYDAVLTVCGRVFALYELFCYFHAIGLYI